MVEHVYANHGGVPKWVRDYTDNDSSKDITFTSKRVEILSIEAYMTNSATVGSRTLCVDLRESVGGNLLWRKRHATGTTATQVAAIALYQAAPYSTTVRPMLDITTANTFIMDALPGPCIMPPGYALKIWDSASIAAAEDDLHYVVHYLELPAP